MRVVDLIEKKKHGQSLSKEEWHELIHGYVHHKIPDYQMSAFLMAVYFKGLTMEETADLTDEMMHSGELLDLSSIDGFKVDKHSTGGVGDKTSLVLGPIVAACGLVVAKMSGRGLGHTGGTLDKLEAIPGMNVFLTKEEFLRQVNDIHLSIIGQSDTLVPADKMIYALRDVTGTVDSIPLIASSIMSKKLAAGTDAILLDVKYGYGAFMKTKEDARKLADTMITIGHRLGRCVDAVLSPMNEPLGCAIGNSLEVIEAINTLQGKGPKDFTDLCVHESAKLLMMAKPDLSEEEAYRKVNDAISSGKAFEIFAKMVKAQGGDVAYIYHPELFKKTKDIIEIKSDISGVVEDLNGLTLGLVSMRLGGGRLNKDDEIDHSVGLVVHKKINDRVDVGDILVTVYSNTGLNKTDEEEIRSSYRIV